MEQITEKMLAFSKSRFFVPVVGITLAAIFFTRLKPQQQQKTVNYVQAEPVDKDILKLSMETALKKDALSYQFKSHELDLDYAFKTNTDNNSTKIKMGELESGTKIKLAEIDSNTQIFKTNKEYDSKNYISLLDNDSKKYVADRQLDAAKEQAAASVKSAKESRSKGISCCFLSCLFGS